MRQQHLVVDAWTSDDQQLVQLGGYEHNLAIDSSAGAMREVARLFEPVSGRVLTLSSTAPGVQFYTGNGLASIDPGHAGVPYRARQGLCLEPQAFPDSPNRPTFPSARIDPGQSYRHQIRFAFTTASSAEATFGA
jgi:aldose 1-epimerase